MGCINSKKERSTNPWSRSVWKSRGRKSRRVAPAMKTCYPHDQPGTTAGKRGPPIRETTSSTVNTVHSTVVMVREITENTIPPVHIEKTRPLSQHPHRYLHSSTGCRPTGEHAQGCGLEECGCGYITEKSDTTAQTIAKVPAGLELSDLTIYGIKLKTPVDPFDHRQKMARNQLTFKHKSTHQQIKMPRMPKKVTFASTAALEIPNDPNIIKRPSSRGGVAFDILIEGSAAVKRKPAAAAARRLGRKRSGLTKAQLDESQERAQQRREELKRKLRERIQAKQERERQIKEALDKFAAHCMEKSAHAEDGRAF